MKKNHLTASTHKWSILFLTVMCPFMGTLDSNIVNVALPVMSDKLQVSSSMVAWVASIYMIVLTAGILPFGRLGDLKGQTRVFQFGMLVFTFGSIFCSLSPSFGWLLAARTIQALGAAATMSNSQGIISRTFPKEERGRALGINGAFVALGTLAGPALGGLIISIAGWQYMFWLNVPIGLAVFIAGFFVFPRESRHTTGKLDWAGSTLFACTMVSLFFALQHGQAMGFTHPVILSCFAAAVASFVVFVWLQLHKSEPLLHLEIFRNKWFSISVFCAFTSYVAISSYSIVFPFYLQDVLQKSAGIAGLYMTIFPLIVVLISPLSGYISDKIGSETMTLLGLLLTSAGLFCMSAMTERTALAPLAAFVGLMAMGNGLFQSPNNALVMSTVPQNQLGIGGSVNALVRCIGQTAGIAMATSLLYGGMSIRIGRHVTNYVSGQNDAFLFGMRLAYITAACVCLLGALMTAARLHKRHTNRQQTEARNM
ncbi:MAG: MFS transporter [Ethanoligenens sp.]